MCVGSGSACLLPARPVGVRICSQRPGAWAARALVSAPCLLAKTCTGATEQVGLVRLIFLQPQPLPLAGGGKVSHGPVPPVRLLGWDGAGTGRVRERRGRPRTCSPPKHVCQFFAVPKLREGVAAEITLQEHPFPPYLPSRTHYVAYIKVDALPLPSLLP